MTRPRSRGPRPQPRPDLPIDQDTIQVSITLSYADYLRAHALAHSEHRTTLSKILSELLHDALAERSQAGQDFGLPGIGR